jgi:hypothetical protein
MNQQFRKFVLVTAVVLMIAQMGLTTLAADAQSPQTQPREKRNSINVNMLGYFLAELPGYIKPEAFNEKWVNQRRVWLNQFRASSEPAKIGASLVELDSYVKETSNDPKWKSRRPGWISEVKAATTNAQLAKLIVEFSGSVKLNMFQPDWKNSRDGWVQRVQSTK